MNDGAAGSAGTPVTGARLDANNENKPWYILGSGTQHDTVQDHVKVKLAYDISAIDNLTNKKHWNCHPYPQRSCSAEVSFDL